MSPVPLLIISDSPAGSTGLGRLTRELATRIHTRMPDVFRVATLGYNGQHSSRLPFPQYQIRAMGPERQIFDLPEVVNDFFHAEAGVLFFIWNPGWGDWLAHPESLTGEENDPLKQLLTCGKVKRWIYAPIDAQGPKGMPDEITEILKGFDRRLFYTNWAAELYGWATRDVGVDHLPHGIEERVFYPRDRKLARDSFMPRIARLPQGSIPDDVMLVGCVATNTPRKDWGLAFETVAKLVEGGKNAILWAHTDSFYKEYDFLNLTQSFGLNHRVIPTKHYLSSDKLAWAYSACDVTLGIGLGEGVGFPLLESLACGVPAIHMPYAGGAEFVPKALLVDPIAWRHEGLYCHRRPVFDANDWATKVIQVTEPPPSGSPIYASRLNPELYWDNLWPRWEEWLTKGLA